jgi:hypothetical protein
LNFTGCAELLYVQILSDRFVVGNGFDDDGDDDFMFGLFRSKEDADTAAEIVAIIAWDKADKQTIVLNRLKLFELARLSDGDNNDAVQRIDKFLISVNSPRVFNERHGEASKTTKTRKSLSANDESTSYTALVKDAGECIKILFYFVH